MRYHEWIVSAAMETVQLELYGLLLILKEFEKGNNSDKIDRVVRDADLCRKELEKRVYNGRYKQWVDSLDDGAKFEELEYIQAYRDNFPINMRIYLMQKIVIDMLEKKGLVERLDTSVRFVIGTSGCHTQIDEVYMKDDFFRFDQKDITPNMLWEQVEVRTEEEMLLFLQAKNRSLEAKWTANQTYDESYDNLLLIEQAEKEMNMLRKKG